MEPGWSQCLDTRDWAWAGLYLHGRRSILDAETGLMSQFVSIASSADGRKLTAAGNLIYTSIDSGTTWVPHDLSDPAMPVVPRFTWSSVAVAADGKNWWAPSLPSFFPPASLTLRPTEALLTTPSGAPLNCYLFASSGDGAIAGRLLYLRDAKRALRFQRLWNHVEQDRPGGV
jgi:hypothetical protein